MVFVPVLFRDQETDRLQRLLLRWHRQRLSSPVSPVHFPVRLSKLPHTHLLRRLHITPIPFRGVYLNLLGHVKRLLYGRALYPK